MTPSNSWWRKDFCAPAVQSKLILSMRGLVQDSELPPPTQLAEEVAVPVHAVPAVAVDLKTGQPIASLS